MLLIMKENAPEWFQILIGSIGAVVYGCALPFYAIIFGGIVGVCVMNVLLTKQLTLFLPDTSK